ncbi:carboxylating nicotinate-nucleotide diphosphorylase [Texcoconibacillus texcoconensis]|uniref:Probable nicotinate-nucleotide pyrophosphorylase [carboxylating] n=1 Tax=Texcoconibacillus texcoconensis TaxID=1095777 RepID=A0A840QRZ1_9BACI|nr:carboxylating nicotinate-nucleotide diphosphorylase [Texcoconibacillus texcoconensis]MBB5174266.1 nicotinate-nucleotide pyrophosphorylase (carboxylating) [Texcoconibacillus texcoconensis]
MNKIALRKQLEQFFVEDIGYGDVTTESMFENEWSQGRFIAKEEGIFVGEEVLKEGYRLFNNNIEISHNLPDGTFVKKGEPICEVYGPINDLLTSERVLLNVVQRMSGIATMTNRMTKVLQASGSTRVIDTRKTTPGLRMFEKHAVVCGGGANHRLRLDDGALIKDNHIAQAGSITKAVEAVKRHVGHMVRVEVEVENEKQLHEAIEAGADIIMFDNVTPATVEKWAKEVPSSIYTEVSGGIDEEQVAQYAETGVDFLSVGALTHSYKSLDISFDVIKKEE